MADTTSIAFNNFGDLTSIAIGRAKIAGNVQDRDLNIIKGAINEHYVNICTERNWTWRKFDRSFEFLLPIQGVGTANVVQYSRLVTFTGITVDPSWLYRTFSVIGTLELFRIIGVDVGNNAVYLDANFISASNATAPFRIYQYEFALPPDLDQLQQVYIDGNLMRDMQLDEINVLEFNRYLSFTTMVAGPPQLYTRDGTIPFNATAKPLDVMLLEYDFLGGEDFDRVAKIRLFPIWPDMNRLIHINYSLMVQPMSDSTDKPIIPVDDRSVLIHFALYEWWKIQGNMNLASMELKAAEKKLKEMRDEHTKTDPKPKFIPDGTRFRRQRLYDRNIDIFRISRLNNTN